MGNAAWGVGLWETGREKEIGKAVGCSTRAARQNIHDRFCTQLQSPGRRGVPGQS